MSNDGSTMIFALGAGDASWEGCRESDAPSRRGIVDARPVEAEEANIDTMLGSMDGAEYVGPRAPDFRRLRADGPKRSAGAAESRAEVTRRAMAIPREENGGREWIRLRSEGRRRSTLYAPGSAASRG